VEQTRVHRHEAEDLSFLVFQLNKRVAEFVIFYFPILQFGILLVALRRLWRRKFCVLWAAMALTLGVSLFGSYEFFVHYVAPLTGICVLFVVEGLRSLENARFKGRPTGMVFAWSVPAILLFMVLMRIVAYPAHLLILPDPFSWSHSGLDNGGLIPIQQQLRKEPRENLVFVRYDGSRRGTEWIYNEADIDHAHTVWARDKGPLNEQLIHYYPEREVWLLEADAAPVRLIRYPAAGRSSASQ
jgi:hypothetical protein